MNLFISALNGIGFITVITAICPEAMSKGGDGKDWEVIEPSESIRFRTSGEQKTIGPFYKFEEGSESRMWAIPPLLSHETWKGVEAEEWDILYPLVTYDRFGSEFRLQLFQSFSFSGGINQESERTKRLTLFPFYFQQRSEKADNNYTALFPIYGHLENRFFRKEIDFLLFPLYLRSEKSAFETRNFLYPFFHTRRGKHTRGVQFWPLFGWENKEISTGRNILKEEVTEPGYRKSFIFWPFYFRNELDLGGANPINERMILPLYRQSLSPARDEYSFLWPLGHYVVDREKDYVEWGFPWPVVEFARGSGKTSNRIWPLFGNRKTANRENQFTLGPLYRKNKRTTEEGQTERSRVLFFLYSDTRETDLETGNRRSQRTDLWPLFTAEKNSQGQEFFQFPAPLEPLLPGNTSIKRNFSPLWSIWRRESDPVNQTSRQSFLWNLYRKETVRDQTKISLFMGLFQYESSADQREWRVFHLPPIRSKIRP